MNRETRNDTNSTVLPVLAVLFAVALVFIGTFAWLVWGIVDLATGNPPTGWNVTPILLAVFYTVFAVWGGKR